MIGLLGGHLVTEANRSSLLATRPLLWIVVVAIGAAMGGMLTAVVLATSCQADSGDSATSFGGPVASDKVTLSTGAMLLRVFMALTLVLGIMAAVLFLYRRAARGGITTGRGRQIEVLSQRSLGPRTSLALVRVSGESLLIGVTPQQITALGKVASEAQESPLLASVGDEPERSPHLALRFEAHAAGRSTVPADVAGVAASERPDGGRTFADTLQSEIHRVRNRLAVVLGDSDRGSQTSRVRV